MTHWGWYWKIKKKHIARKLCSALPSIDSFRLYKDGMRGFTVQPLEVKAEATANNLIITYRNRKEHSYTIAIEKLPCNYGGYRYYFKCPLCTKRMRFLYFAENSIFLCRKCLNLSYESQRLRPTKRYEYMKQKLKCAIKKQGGDLDLYQRPKHMHNSTFKMFKSRYFDYFYQSSKAFYKEMKAWHGEKIDPYLDEDFDC